MKIGSFDTDRKVLIVAEVGNNHEGKFGVAQDLVRKAAESGADAVKFQTFQTDLFQSPGDAARVKRLKGFELTYPQFEDLGRLARSLGMLFISTPLDLESARFLEPVVDALKIASGDNNFEDLLTVAARGPRPLIISTGMSDLDQVRRTLACVKRSRPDLGSVGLLHCVSAYPAPLEQVNLRALPTLAEGSGVTLGYSDHTMGIEAAVLSIALGARIVEKHFTHDKNASEFRDHKLSADPPELKELVRRVREAEAILGTPEKKVQPAEIPVAAAARRSLAAARDLPAGHRLRREDFLWLRPAGGLPPGEEGSLLGRPLVRSVSRGEFLRGTDVQ